MSGLPKENHFIAIDRSSKFVVVRLCTEAGGKIAREFLELLLTAVPSRIHATLTDNGIQFAD